eukprot:GFUD01110662.1.p1 GENE.GFUD01110662.1~~GFUD01110662.1.p1  ORF type:complete len:167 (+),score=42.25 GFUD01110662.1:31-531(+)
MADKADDPLSAVGVKSEEYKIWKTQTLAKQTSHKEGKQRTGLWQNFEEVTVKPVKDLNEYRIELAPGCRMASSGGVLATWSCPSYKKLGCPTVFSARIDAVEIEEDLCSDLSQSMDESCRSSTHCQGCKDYEKDQDQVNPVIFGIFSLQFWEAVRTSFCWRVFKEE